MWCELGNTEGGVFVFVLDKAALLFELLPRRWKLSQHLLKNRWGYLELQGNLKVTDENLSLIFEDTVLEEANRGPFILFS